MMATVTEDMIISDVLALDNETISILFAHGLHCIGCMHATSESLKEACAVHGIDVGKLVDDLNAFLAEKQ